MDTAPIESWRPVVGYEQWYEVSNLGRVRRHGNASSPNAKVGRVLRGTGSRADRNECPMMRLFDGHGSDYRQVLLSTIVAAAWYGQRPDGQVINHKDGDRKNNAVANLEYTTYAGNARHARDVLGKIARQRLTSGQVVRIKELIRGGLGPTAIGRMFGVHKNTIDSIRAGRSWRVAYVPTNGQPMSYPPDAPTPA